MVRPDGSVIDFAVTPLPDGATLITFADVTDSKRYERALIERNEALVAADRLKNQFISHVSYELRTPLTNIIGFSELLGQPAHRASSTSKQREYLGDISASSKTLLAIIDDILDLATIDAGAMELKLGAGRRSGGHRRGHPRRARSAPSAPACRCDIAVAEDATEFIADEARVRQVLYNLLSNAVGFSKPGDTIGITCLARGRHDGVRRRGPGRRHPQGPAVEACSSASRAAARAPSTAAPASGCRSSRAWSSCTAAPCRSNPSPATARASLCAFPSTAGLIKHPRRRCPKKALRARYRPVAAPLKVNDAACSQSPLPTSSTVSASPSWSAWASSWRSSRGAAICSR